MMNKSYQVIARKMPIKNNDALQRNTKRTIMFSLKIGEVLKQLVNENFTGKYTVDFNFLNGVLQEPIETKVNKLTK